MNSLLKQLEALEITGDLSEAEFWSACTDLVQESFLPEATFCSNRPCEEKDFREHRQLADRNLRSLKSMLQHILHGRIEGTVQIDCSIPIVRNFATNLLLLIGEHHEKNAWNTIESIVLSKELASGLLELYGCQSVSQFLLELDNFVTVLLALRPKLCKDTWKHYPAAVACYKWLLHEIEKPALYNHIEDVLPTALIIVDDYMPDNVLIGLQCLQRIVEHSHLKKGLIDTGYTKVIFHALEGILRQREAKYVIPVYACMANVLATIEHWDTNLNMFEWTKRDLVLAALLDNMEFEQNIELRRAYMLSLPQLLTNIGGSKWCERLTRILSEYCEHHTDLRTLKATLETAKTFLLMFHLRVAAHCVPLYTAFLKLHFDLNETPVFDKEIMQNLQDCICLLYELSPNVGCAIVHDDRIRSVIKNNLQVVCLGDTKYFE